MRSTLLLTMAMAGLSYAQETTFESTAMDGVLVTVVVKTYADGELGTAIWTPAPSVPTGVWTTSTAEGPWSSYVTVMNGVTFGAVIKTVNETPLTYYAIPYTATIPAGGGETASVFSTVHTYPPGYLEAISSLNSVIATEAVKTSVYSVAAQATGVAGSAVTAYSSLRAKVTGVDQTTLLNDYKYAQSWLKDISSVFTLLPTEVQSYENNVASRYDSVFESFGIFAFPKSTSSFSTTTKFLTNATATGNINSTTSLLTTTATSLLATTTTSTSTGAAVASGAAEKLGMGATGLFAAAGAAGLGVVAMLL